MQKTVLTQAAVLALASLGMGAAWAQSSLTLYGNLDVGVTHVRKGEGKPAGTLVNASPTLRQAMAAKSTITGLTSSLSSVNAIGLKGVEDLGGGYKGNFVLEGQMQVDLGAQSGQDNRMWGRQAYVGVTTPVGELRLGRQYAPMFYTFATTTIEALGGLDLQGFGLVVNNLQVRQDNQVSYWLKKGGFTGAISYSPNAGVAPRVSSMRQITGASDASGQIAGGLTAGNEAADSGQRGGSAGLFLHYAVNADLALSAAYHDNKFGNAVLGLWSGAFTPLADLDKYRGYALAAKYVAPGSGTVVSGQLHQGKFDFDSGNADGPKVTTISLGVKQPIGNFAVGAQVAQSKFNNFTEGKDTAFMLIGDYNFSKRTRLYVRAGLSRDKEGKAAQVGRSNLTTINGGPVPLLTGLGSIETPLFSGSGANIGETTRILAVGLRHQF